MGWFSKKKEEEQEIDETSGLPDLPEFPESSNNFNLPSKDNLPGLPDLEVSDLPSIPTSEKKLSEQETIKQAVSLKKMQKSSFNLPPPPTHNIHPAYNTSLPEITHRHPRLIETETPRTIELPEKHPHTFIKSSIKKAEPIYIRLDKFQTTADSFEEIQNKITEIEKLLRKTKEIKEQEGKELEEWENELQAIKARIEFIDRNVFNKLD